MNAEYFLSHDVASLIYAQLEPKDLLSLSLTCTKVQQAIGTVVPDLHTLDASEAVLEMPMRVQRQGGRRIAVRGPTVFRIRNKFNKECWSYAEVVRRGYELKVVRLFDSIWFD